MLETGAIRVCMRRDHSKDVRTKQISQIYMPHSGLEPAQKPVYLLFAPTMPSFYSHHDFLPFLMLFFTLSLSHTFFFSISFFHSLSFLFSLPFIFLLLIVLFSFFLVQLFCTSLLS